MSTDCLDFLTDWKGNICHKLHAWCCQIGGAVLSSHLVHHSNSFRLQRICTGCGEGGGGERYKLVQLLFLFLLRAELLFLIENENV